jgi:hypothetical protein
MTYLTDSFKEAAQRAANWKRELFLAALHDIAQRLTTPTIDWDPGVPEQWGRVWSGDGSKAAMLCLKIPLAIVTESARGELDAVLEKYSLVSVTVRDWNDRSLCMDPQVLKDVFGLAELSSALNPTAFSNEELWYATVAA